MYKNGSISKKVLYQTPQSKTNCFKVHSHFYSATIFSRLSPNFITLVQYHMTASRGSPTCLWSTVTPPRTPSLDAVSLDVWTEPLKPPVALKLGRLSLFKIFALDNLRKNIQWNISFLKLEVIMAGTTKKIVTVYTAIRANLQQWILF